MNLTIYRMEMRRNFRSFAIWSAAICGLLFFGMMFYPAINADGLLLQMEALFENPMMKGVLAAFGADIYSMSSLSGFYVTYNSIYNIILACIFAAVLAGNLLAREEADKTAEFLFTKPVSRSSIFISKSAVLISYTGLLAILFFLTSIAALEAVKHEAPRMLSLLPSDQAILTEQIHRHPGRIYDAFDLDDESFSSISLSYASSLLTANTTELDEMDLDLEAMNELIEEAAQGPEEFFSRVLESPEEYMSVLGVAPSEMEGFLKDVRGQREEFREMRESFYRSPELLLLFLEEQPSLILNQFASTQGSMETAIAILDLPPDFESRIFIQYRVRDLAVISVYVYLLIIAMGSLVLLISLLMNRGRSVLGPSLGLIFFFYFIKSLSSMAAAISPAATGIGYLSPFSWMNTNAGTGDFGLELWRVMLFCALTALCQIAAARVLTKKDILV